MTELVDIKGYYIPTIVLLTSPPGHQRPGWHYASLQYSSIRPLWAALADDHYLQHHWHV